MKKIEKLFVPYELAVKLKELGFVDKCLASYYTKIEENNKYNMGGHFNGLEYHEVHHDYEPNFIINTDKDYYVSAPVWDQAFEWFRMIKNLDGLISFDNDIEDEGYEYQYGYEIRNWNTKTIYYNAGWHKNELWCSFEEARYACLKKLIEII